MPLTKKGEEIKSAMTQEYGAKKGEEVFYASKNKGTISGVDAIARATDFAPGPGFDAVMSWGGNVNGETVLPGGKGDAPSLNSAEKAAVAIGSTGKPTPEPSKVTPYV